MTKLLVTLDGSSLSEQVLPHAAKLAQRLKADVHLLMVAQASGGGMEEGVAPAFDRFIQAGTPVDTSVGNHGTARDDLDLESYLKERALRFESSQPLIRLLDGEDPAEQIVDYVRREGIDYIAMATHGRGGLSEVIQGSVAQAVVRAGEAPVFLVRPKDED